MSDPVGSTSERPGLNFIQSVGRGLQGFGNWLNPTKPAPAPQPGNKQEPEEEKKLDSLPKNVQEILDEALNKHSANTPNNGDVSVPHDEKPENSEGKDGKKDTNGEDDKASSTPKQSFLSNMANLVANSPPQPPQQQNLYPHNPYPHNPYPQNPYPQIGAAGMGAFGTAGMGAVGASGFDLSGQQQFPWMMPQTNFLTAPNPYANGGMMGGGGMGGMGGMGMMDGGMNHLILPNFFGSMMGGFGDNAFGGGNAFGGRNAFGGEFGKFGGGIGDIGGLGGIGGIGGLGGMGMMGGIGGMGMMGGMDMMGMMAMPPMLF